MMLWMVFLGAAVVVTIIYGVEVLVHEGEVCRRAARIAGVAGVCAYLLLHFRLFWIG
ncbi:MAG TPA: hypothetical protein VGK74_24710 [Symbiobacteriaceae bacterium]|jgi:hypothetical protein